MNWTNYDRLVAHLEAIKREPRARRFNYWNDSGGSAAAGCLACRVREVAGLRRWAADRSGIDDIQKFLGVTYEEAGSLFAGGGEHSGGFQNSPSEGIDGINEALRRLREWLAPRYQRPAEAPTVDAIPFDVDAAARSFVSRMRVLSLQRVSEQAEP